MYSFKVLLSTAPTVELSTTIGIATKYFIKEMVIVYSLPLSDLGILCPLPLCRKQAFEKMY